MHLRCCYNKYRFVKYRFVNNKTEKLQTINDFENRYFDDISFKSEAKLSK